VSNTTTDFYHQKTDAELLYFVEHPEHYQPSVVDAARQELRRRGVPLAAPVPIEPDLYSPSGSGYGPQNGGSKMGVLNALLGALLLFGLGGYYFFKQKDRPAATVVVSKPKGPPQLTEVATSAIPNFDGAVAKAVAEQLSRMPASEKANAQHLRQFRELSKRFWTAETQTEYLVNLAHEGKPGPMYNEQAYLVRENWQNWNHANPYTYKFGKRMSAQLESMRSAASSQQNILNNMPALLPERRFLTDKEMQSREADVQAWLSEILPVSPVTGRPYKPRQMTITM
jgi:hypothetical protein